jgi:hypothetical protein
MKLRKFQYLDTDTLDDYLSTLEGFVIDSPVDEIEKETKGVKGEAGYKGLIGAGGGVEKSREVKQTLAVTDAAKFQKLYSILEGDEGFIYLDLIDNSVWNKIRRGDLIELEGNIRFPKFLSIINAIQGLNSTIDLVQITGNTDMSNIYDDTTYKGFLVLSEMASNRPLTIIMEPSSTSGYCFTANIKRDYIRPGGIEGEATIFGKVERIILDGEKFEVFNLLPDLDEKVINSFLKMNRKQKKVNFPSELKEIIKGPALVLHILAIYR